MADKRRLIEIFSAGCPVCEDAIEQIRNAACESCGVKVRDMKSPEVQIKAADLGVASLPAVAVDGKLTDCCTARGVDLGVLTATGFGQAIAWGTAR